MKVEEVEGVEEEEAKGPSVIVAGVGLIMEFRMILGLRISGMEMIIEVDVGVEEIMQMGISTSFPKRKMEKVGFPVLMEDEGVSVGEAVAFPMAKDDLLLDDVSMNVEAEQDVGK